MATSSRDTISCRHHTAKPTTLIFLMSLKIRRNLNGREEDDVEFALNLDQLDALNKAIVEHGFDCGIVELLNFIKRTSKCARRSKVPFLQNISTLLDLLSELERMRVLTERNGKS